VEQAHQGKATMAGRLALGLLAQMDIQVAAAAVRVLLEEMG
jgi:hypothetical protein